MAALVHLSSDVDSAEPVEVPASAYHCRGCGGLLPGRSSTRFHPECLKADKRRRLAERRQREGERFQARLKRQRCPDCGASLEKLAKIEPRRPLVSSCEASQGGQASANSTSGVRVAAIDARPARTPRNAK